MTADAAVASRTTSSARWAGAIVVTVLSIALAEVSIGSEPWALLFPLHWILMVPVYGCQVLLLAVIVFRVNPRPTLAALWCAGVLMGLYEFYITHVLWDQPWDDRVNSGLVEWASLIVIAGFWHPFVATIVPLVLAEQLLVERPTLLGLFPRWVREPRAWLAWVAVVIAGITAGGLYVGRAPWEAPVALGLTALAVWLVVRWVGRRPRVAHIADALPRGGGVVALVVIVSVLFAAFIVIANTTQPEPLERQAFAVACYAFFVGLAAANLRRSARVTQATEPDAAPARVRRLPWGWLAATIVVTASLAQFLPLAPAVAIITIWLGGGALALTMLGIATVNGVRALTHPTRSPRPGS
jgi:hypothetical protein